MIRSFSVHDHAALLMGAADALDEAIPDDPTPVVQTALREAARALYNGRAPDFDAETIAYLEQFEASLRALEASR